MNFGMSFALLGTVSQWVHKFLARSKRSTKVICSSFLLANIFLNTCASAQGVPFVVSWQGMNHFTGVTGSSPAAECALIFLDYVLLKPHSGETPIYYGVSTINGCVAGVIIDANPGFSPIPGAMDYVYPYYGCPPGYVQTAQSGNTCVPPGPPPNLNKGKCKPCEANPINPLTGNKYQVERDYTGEGAFPIVVERVYNSFGSGPGTTMGYAVVTGTNTSGAITVVANSSGTIVQPTVVGAPSNALMDYGWRLNYDRTLVVTSGSSNNVTLYRSDSKTRTFSLNNGMWVADPGQLLTVLTQQIGSNGVTLGWTYVNENDETEAYDANGRLVSITNRAGLIQTLQYNGLGLASVTDAFGRVLTFNYYGGYVSGFTAPDKAVYSYTYTTDGNNNLSNVTYPDNRTRQYVYENTQYKYALTGIIDENGNRFATYNYDVNGYAVLSEHSGGVEAVALTYPTSTSTTATDAGGAVRSYSTQIVNGIALAGSISETCGANCTRTSKMSYDVDGNISSTTDYNGNITTYSYDLTRDLETSRTEAAGTAQARTITTSWHPTFRLPMIVTEPGRTTTYAYDPNGNMLSKTITAGSSTRAWTYTYNTNGQVLTVTGPRSDVLERTTYTYDSSGNLNTITNALNQVTTLTNYDANGRVGLITDSNGNTTTLTYAPRGWLNNKLVTAGNVVQSTSYSYDDAGQMIGVTLPDGSSLTYTYDPAHRLTNIQDNFGNTVNYDLDLMGNRKNETVKDPSGNLTRQISRIFDSVNRLQQVTGAAQ